MIKVVDAHIIVLGHTHHPVCIEYEGRLIVNPGSIYENRNRPERTCAVLSLLGCGFDLYDLDTSLKCPF